ncbi:UNVERIFIED_CONTAM: RNA-dependent RNA polymerase 2 [Sesamum calycinum]|uniref:RNA-dependent RNA polymerase n=1 Tax=Sesamum calycinum TaxID=2727403 RepID=A0AAW2NHP1_9LAMI
MLTKKEAALNVLESTGGGEMKSILARMLLQGYEPDKEPYLLTMLQSHLENQLSDLRSRCRIFVPRGRVLVGCLDETASLEYGQVYVRLTMNKSELQCGDQRYFQRVDETTSVVKGKVVVHVFIQCMSGFLKPPHPNECSGGDLDGDLYFISWDENLITARTVDPMDYTGRRPRIMDHDVTLEEIERFFADYMISDTLGTISTAHLIHADREPEKALSPKCLELATLHSMAVDFAKTGAPAEMPRALKPREFPDFMERWEKPMYISRGVLGKLYHGYEDFLETAESHKAQYLDKMETMLNYYGAESEVEILTGDMQKKSAYLQRDNRRYGEVKDRIMVSVKSLMKEVKGWFRSSCSEAEQQKLASAWYFVTYHPTYSHGSANCLGFPWAVGDVLLDIKSAKNGRVTTVWKKKYWSQFRVVQFLQRVSDNSNDALVLPTTFVKNSREKLAGSVVLKTPNGGEYVVELEAELVDMPHNAKERTSGENTNKCEDDCILISPHDNKNSATTSGSVGGRTTRKRSGKSSVSEDDIDFVSSRKGKNVIRAMQFDQRFDC